MLSDDVRRILRDFEGTMYELSARSGIPQSVLSRFRSKETTLSLASLDKLGKCLGLKIVVDPGEATVQKK